MTALTRWCMRRRLLVVSLWLALLAAAGVGTALAGSAYSNDYDVPGTESGRAAQLLTEAFPDRAGDGDTLVWHTGEDGPGDGVRDAAVRDRMTATLDDIAGLPGVADVRGPYQPGPESQERISEDGRTAYATVSFDAPADELDESQVQRVVDTAHAAGDDGRDLRVEMGGTAVALTEGISGHLAEAVGIAVAAVVLLLAFGSLAAMLLPLVTAVLSVGTAALATGLLSHAMTVADFAPMLGTLIGLGVGIDYALFIVTRHRKGLKQGMSVPEAAQRAMSSAGRAVVFAGVTVCIALLGMLVLRLTFLNGVALAASLTVVLTVLASVTLLPALLGVIGHRVLSRRERRALAEHGPDPAGPDESEAEAGKRTRRGGPVARWSAFVERHPKLLAGLAAVFMAVLALPVFALHLGSSDQGSGPGTATTRQAYDLMAEGFGPGTNGPLTLVGEIDGAAAKLAFEELPERLRGTEGVAEVSGPELNGSGSVGVITVVPDSAPQDERTSQLVDRLREQELPEVSADSPLTVHVGGVTAGQDDFASVILGKLPMFTGVIVALGCALLLLAFRSIGIPLKAAVMNILAVAAASGVVVAVFQWGWGSELLGLGGPGPIEPFLPVIMVSVLFGLSMDYQVFMVSRMYEEWQRTGDNRRAVRVGLAETGRVINSAAVIMIAVFGAFVLSGDRIIAMFGIGLAVAVALDAFVLRTLLVPALMHMLGGANWWLPRWLDRCLPRITIEPGEHAGDGDTPGPAPVPAPAEPVLPGPRSGGEGEPGPGTEPLAGRRG
ncbi:MMPL family transporter [Streptomyces sp. HNM0574]|uniref:MMPL family transporter n=1 Tax=Streptomyces sp. HNM0574 TaxID=2714954 RepID=UPI00146CB23C|nr:MMPL family transporter [Streptomyces sp. HNM0574]NLU67000.1 MMPL family transporter [Streptomyces sp. HNM0574]